MNIFCGRDAIDIYQVESVCIRTALRQEILKVERETNGSILSAKDVFSPSLFVQLRTILKDFPYDICNKLPEPMLTKADLDTYKSDYRDIEKISNWHISGHYKLTLESTAFEEDGDASIRWSFTVQKHTMHESDTARTSRTIKLHQIIPILEKLVNLPKPKNAWSAFWKSYSYKDIQRKIKPFFDEYQEGMHKVTLRLETRDAFLDAHKGKSVFCINFVDGTSKKYLDGHCDFDFLEKEAEINHCLHRLKEHQKKLSNSNNPGEKAVEYALQWIIASHNGRIVSIKNDCESKYRYNCIVLCKPDFIDEPQEYDHILVCPAGVVLIETKHWKGAIEIREDGKWLRKEDVDTPMHGVDSPKLQMRLHETLMQQILPDVPVHSLLCLSHASTVVDGRDNFKDYPIVMIDQLDEALTAFCTNELYNKNQIDQMVATIESYKLLKNE